MMNRPISLGMHTRSMRLGVLALVLGLCITATGAAPCQQTGSSEKEIERSKFIRYTPVELVEIRDKTDAPLALSEPFTGDDEWLKGMTFKLKNVFTKDMIYIELVLNFPETKGSGNEMAFPLRFGDIPLKNEIEDIPALKPGEETALKVDEHAYSELKRFLQDRQPVEGLNRVRVEVRTIFFSDHTGWNTGDFYVQDQDNPRHFSNVGATLPNQ